MVTTGPSEAQLAEVPGLLLDEYDDWDSPFSHFITLPWGGHEIMCGSLVRVPHGIGIDELPDVMFSAAICEIREFEAARREGRPCLTPWAYALHVHSRGVPQPEEGQPGYEEFQRDLHAGHLDRRADAFDAALVWCADFRGHLSFAAKRRDTGKVDEISYDAANHPDHPLVHALLGVCYLAGAMVHRQPLPMPAGMDN